MSIGSVASQAFVPNKIADLVLWLEAPDLGTITESAGFVSGWEIKSVLGVGDAIQGTGSEQPLTGTNTIGGKNVITFDAFDDRLVIAVNTVLKGLWETGATLICAYRSNTVTAFGRLIASGTEWGLFKSGGDTQFGLIADFTTTNADFRSDSLYSASAAEIVAITYDASSTSNVPAYYLNGSLIGTTVGITPVGTYVPADGSIGIGNETFSNIRPFGGDIAEIIIIKRIITPGELLEAHTYLSNKYGITLA